MRPEGPDPGPGPAGGEEAVELVQMERLFTNRIFSDFFLQLRLKWF